MDFGALPRQTPFDPRLAPLRAESVRALPGSLPGAVDARVGAPVWGTPAWNGNLFPKKLSPSRKLEAYSRQWNSIELNTSFYSVPEAARVREWAAQTPADFRFYVKVHQELSHERENWNDPSGIRARIQGFVSAWENLEAKWGASFLQLPPFFSRADLGRLEYWLTQWPAERPLHVEFRHPSFFEGPRLHPEVFALLRAYGAGSVCLDTPGRREVAHGDFTHDRFWLVRFLAQTSQDQPEILPQDRERIMAWAKRLAELTRRGLQGFGFFIHSPEEFWIPELTRIFMRELRTRLGEDAGAVSALQEPTNASADPEPAPPQLSLL